jgi:hypothetical protein
VGEFLFGWCPRKLSAAPDQCAEISGVGGGFRRVPGPHRPARARHSQVRRYCERNTARFVREMAKPANFGMAKSLFGAVDGLESGADRPPRVSPPSSAA